MATSAKGKKPAGGGGMNAKVLLGALGIAVISSLSSFVAIRLAMPQQVIIEKHIVTEKGKVVNGTADKPEEVPGPTYQVGDFVVNLTDVGRHYLKATVVLQFVADAPTGDKKQEEKKEGGEGGAKDDPLKAELAPFEPLYKDTIISTLSRQSSARLKTPGGIEMVKDELKVALNKAVSAKKVMSVFFTDFVIQ